MAETTRQTHRVDDPEAIQVLIGIGHALTTALETFNAQRATEGKPAMGFGLFLFEFGDGGNMFWLSNAQRDTMQAALAEFLAKEAN